MREWELSGNNHWIGRIHPCTIALTFYRPEILLFQRPFCEKDQNQRSASKLSTRFACKKPPSHAERRQPWLEVFASGLLRSTSEVTSDTPKHRSKIQLEADYSATYGINAMNRARFTALVIVCWLTAVQPFLRRPTMRPWRLTSLESKSISL